MEGEGKGGSGGGGRREGGEAEGEERELIQRFTYTCTCVSHVTELSAAIYKGAEKYRLNHCAGL